MVFLDFSFWENPFFYLWLLACFLKECEKSGVGKPLLRESFWRELASARCRLSRVVFVQVGGLPTRYTTALPCILPLLARAPGYPVALLLSILACCYYKRPVALPTLGIRVGYRIRLPRPCALLPYVLQGREKAEYGSSLPTCPIPGFGSATRGRWRFGLVTAFRILTGLPQGCYRLRLPCSLGALAVAPSRRAFIGLSYSLKRVTPLELPRPARSPAVSDRDHEGFGFRLTPSRMPSPCA